MGHNQPMITIEHSSGVATVRWDDGENRFTAQSVQAWHDTLDTLEAHQGPLAVVVTGADKFFSNGLDLDGFAADPAAAPATIDGVHRLFGRLLVFPAYVVGALNGHTFAAGAMLSCCLDTRVMRTDRGYWCLPEADLGLPLTPEMFAAVTARLPVATAADAMNTGRRYTADEALRAGIVEHTGGVDEVLPLAQELAAQVAGKDRSVIARHKHMLFAAAARACGHQC